MRMVRARDLIDCILSCRNFAVIGASQERYGADHSVSRALREAGYNVVSIDRDVDILDDTRTYPMLDNVPWPLDCIVVVAHPEVAFDAIHEAGRLRIPYVWMQPGVESTEAILQAEAEGLEAVHGGPSITFEIARRFAA